ncbi:MAG: hypothetical protein U9Q16_01350 [Patescibacteria group bacterium]|nr:hypothetical protein [Patescibacteria group bacterium]
MKKLILSIIILGLILAVAGYWYWQRNPYSKDVLKLEIFGPEEVSLLQEVEYIVKYKNNGNVRLEEPKLIFEFPEYTIVSPINGEEGQDNLSIRQEIGPEELGDIYPGEEKTFRFKGRLFGKENQLRTAKAWMNYRPKNLKPRYESSTTFSTMVKSVPLTVEFDIPSKVESDRNFDFSLNYFSNLDYPLSNLGIKIKYPSSFEFLESIPKTLNKEEWEVPLLNKAEGGRIEVTGKLLGNLKDQKIFQAIIGLWVENEFIEIKEISRGVEITKPRLSVFQRINNENQYFADAGDLLHYEIYFRNVGEDPFTDLFLVSRLEGKGFDFDSIKSSSGQFSKGDNSIVWDWRDSNKLRYLDQGEEGKVEFWINLKDEWIIDNPGDKNAILKNTILVSQIKEEFETKVNSKLTISQKGYYNEEVFGNSGPLPPKVGETTTYTIIWQAQNYFNDVKNVRVKAILPANVRLTGKIFPEQEKSRLTYDNNSREIVWTIEDSETIEAGTGVLNQAPNIAFQVALTPSSNQNNMILPIIEEARISGEDQWTEMVVSSTIKKIDTTLPDDPSVNEQTQ